MQITNVRMHVSNPPLKYGHSRVLGFASVELDYCFVIRDFKIVEDSDGRLFVGMPCRRLMDKCPSCKCKNFILSDFCNGCGGRLPETHVHRRMDHEKVRIYTDVAHPINRETRETFNETIIQAYRDAVSKKVTGDASLECE